MAAPVTANISLDPFTVTFTTPEPKDEELERLKEALKSASLSANRQSFLLQEYRVREALFFKEHGAEFTLRRALEIICYLQREFLIPRTLERSLLKDLSLNAVAQVATTSPIDLAIHLMGCQIQHPARKISVDEILGPVAMESEPRQMGYIDPRYLIPTDEPRDPETVSKLEILFKQRRQSILDPILAVDDPLRPECGLVCQGHHRAAAAFRARAQVRVRVLRDKSELKFLSEGAVGEFARYLSYPAFVERCRQQSMSTGLYKGGWPAYLARLETETTP